MGEIRADHLQLLKKLRTKALSARKTCEDFHALLCAADLRGDITFQEEPWTHLDEDIADIKIRLTRIIGDGETYFPRIER
jgi:hypothetical protein